MNKKNPISAALILGSLFVSASVSAQEACQVSPAGTVNSDGSVAPVGTVNCPGADDQDHPGTDNRAPGDQRDDDSTRGCPQLEMEVSDNEIRVSGGRSGDTCTLLLGLERASFPLPGGAELKLDPLAVLAIGVFDEAGEYRWRLQADVVHGQPFSVLVQAVTGDETGCFGTSPMWSIDYHGNGEFDGRQVAMVDILAWHTPVAARRVRLA